MVTASDVIAIVAILAGVVFGPMIGYVAASRMARTVRRHQHLAETYLDAVEHVLRQSDWAHRTEPQDPLPEPLEPLDPIDDERNFRRLNARVGLFGSETMLAELKAHGRIGLEFQALVDELRQMRTQVPIVDVIELQRVRVLIEVKEWEIETKRQELHAARDRIVQLANREVRS